MKNRKNIPVFIITLTISFMLVLWLTQPTVHHRKIQNKESQKTRKTKNHQTKKNISTEKILSIENNYQKKIYTEPDQKNMQKWIKNRPKNMQQTINQIIPIAKECHNGHKKLLVFGLGHDSYFWANIVNPNQRTVFIENHPQWFAQITKKYPSLEAYPYQYKTKMYQENFFMNPENSKNLFMHDLPNQILQTVWDVILVDAPAGYDGKQDPGRFQSIYTAPYLANKGALIIIDDCERPLEEKLINKFIKPYTVLEHTEIRQNSQRQRQCYFRLHTTPKQKTLQIIEKSIPVIAMCDTGMLEYATNFLEHLHKIQNLTFFLYAKDKNLFQKLVQQNPQNEKHLRFYLQNNTESNNQHKTYGSSLYKQYVRKIPDFIHFLLFHEKIQTFLYSDVDVVFFKNPQTHLNNFFPHNLMNYDLIAQNDDDKPHQCDINASGNFCSGLFFVNLRNEKIINLFLSEWKNNLDKNKNQPNQPSFNHAIQNTKNLQFNVLPCQNYPNGFRAFKTPNFSTENAVAVHANWIIGEEKKNQLIKNLWWIEN